MAEFHQLPARKDTIDPQWQALNLEAEQRTKQQQAIASMPSLDHLSMADYQEVYEPAEDTYLFLDALLYEFEQKTFALDRERLFVVLEIGCGSGVVSVYFRQEWSKRTSDPINNHSESSGILQSYVTDVNRKALKVALQTDQINNSNRDNNSARKDGDGTACSPCLSPMEGVHCDLASVFLPRWMHRVDVILFNPPYVPTDDSEVGSHSIEAAWAGGENGRRVVDRFIKEQLSLLLRPQTGICYMVTVDDNQPHEMAKWLHKDYQLDMKPLFRRRARNEYLTIQKITHDISSGHGGS